MEVRTPLKPMCILVPSLNKKPRDALKNRGIGIYELLVYWMLFYLTGYVFLEAHSAIDRMLLSGSLFGSVFL